jgi:nucleoside-diphosphate-sugar epimerase
VVVNLTLGDYLQIEANTRNVCDACAAEQARLLIHVSSAEVFGRVENPNVNDDSQPDLRHWMSYGRGKARAELALRARMSGAAFAIVVLRPGLVWGPGSSWTVGPVRDLLNQRAFLADGGKGICNLIYIDNLISAIRRVMRQPRPASGFYNVADRETLTWVDYYGELARRLDVPFDRVPHLASGDYTPSLAERVEEWRQTKIVKRIEGAIPNRSMRVLKKQLRRAWRLIHANTAGACAKPSVTRSLWHLQHTQHKLPTAKFDATFGNAQEFTFTQAMDKTWAWLRFAGFAAPAPERGAQ